MKHTELFQMKPACFPVNGGTPAGCTPPPPREVQFVKPAKKALYGHLLFLW